jgi:hypothetical protein
MHGSSPNQGNGCAGGEGQDAMSGLMQDAVLQIDGTAEACAGGEEQGLMQDLLIDSTAEAAGSGGGAAGVESEAGSAAEAKETESQTATAAAAAAAAAVVAAAVPATEPLSPGAVGAADLAEGAYSQSSGVGRAECAHPVCEAYLSELMQAARPFLPCNMDPPALQGLKCLRCQTVEEYDDVLGKCLESVAGAVLSSLTQQNKNAEAKRTLWYHAGNTLVEAGNSGLLLPESFTSAVAQMLEHEVKGPCKTQAQLPSISPWDGMILGLPPDLILQISVQYSRLLKLKNACPLRDYDGGDFVVAFISADLVDHSTAHIVTAELIEMSKMQQQGLILWVVCVAKPERIASMNHNCPYRTALKENLGTRFLEVGHLSPGKKAAALQKVHPHAILHAGFHECDDQPQILNGSLDSIVVQTVAHAGPTGSNRVDFILASPTAIPTANEAHFREKVLRIDAPFLGNSFRAFFDCHADHLHQVRTIPGARSQVRKALGLPIERKLLTNISSPNRLTPDYFGNLIIPVLRCNPDTDMVLVDHDTSFNVRIKARFKALELENRLWFVPYQDLHNGSLHRFIGAVEVYVNNGGYSGHTALNDALWAANAVISWHSDYTLAGTIAADLHTAFGTPENLCRTAAEATERINQLLQSPEAYAQACLKSERCRRDSSM